MSTLKRFRSSVRVLALVHTSTGRITYGQSQEILSVGFPQPVAVPVDRSLTDAVAKGKPVTLIASVDPIGGKRRSGVGEKLILQKDVGLGVL